MSGLILNPWVLYSVLIELARKNRLDEGKLSFRASLPNEGMRRRRRNRAGAAVQFPIADAVLRFVAFGTEDEGRGVLMPSRLLAQQLDQALARLAPWSGDGAALLALPRLTQQSSSLQLLMV